MHKEAVDSESEYLSHQTSFGAITQKSTEQGEVYSRSSTIATEAGIADAARRRGASSEAAKASEQRVIQKAANRDTVYNWRPHKLRPPLLAPYFPAFAAFREALSSVDKAAHVTPDELQSAIELIILSTQFYRDEDDRHANIFPSALFSYKKTTYSKLAQPELADRRMFPDHHRTCPCPLVGKHRVAHPEFVELKAEVGVGGSDPIAQAERDYVSVYTSEYVRPSSPSPSPLVARVVD